MPSNITPYAQVAEKIDELLNLLIDIAEPTEDEKTLIAAIILHQNGFLKYQIIVS